MKKDEKVTSKKEYPKRELKIEKKSMVGKKTIFRSKHYPIMKIAIIITVIFMIVIGCILMYGVALFYGIDMSMPATSGAVVNLTPVN